MLFAMSSYLLCGCGRDPALDEYKEKMDTYFTNTSIINTNINSIDPQTDINGEQLLGYLDQLETLTIDMAGFDVPEQFSIVESLADEAAENMTSAVSLYHQFYSEEEPNINISDAAYEYYLRANKRIKYVRSILQGDMPEELVVVEDDGTQIQNEQSTEEGVSPTTEEVPAAEDDGADDFDTDDTVFYEGE